MSSDLGNPKNPTLRQIIVKLNTEDKKKILKLVREIRQIDYL